MDYFVAFRFGLTFLLGIGKGIYFGVVVALANLDPPAATEVARFIAARLPVK